MVFLFLLLFFDLFSVSLSESFENPLLLSSLFNNNDLECLSRNGDNIISLDRSSVVVEPILFNNMNYKVVGDENAGIVAVEGNERSCPAFVVWNSSISIYETSINIEKNRFLSNVELDGAFNLVNIKIYGILNEGNLFSVNGGSININKASFGENCELNSFIDVKDKGSKLFVSNVDLKDIIVNEEGLFFSNESIINDCKIVNLTKNRETKEKMKMKIGKEENIKNSNFEGCENVLTGLILNNNGFHYFYSFNNSYCKITNEVHSTTITPTLENTTYNSDTFQECSSKSNGGGIECNVHYLYVTKCKFVDCSSDYFGGGIYYYNEEGQLYMNYSSFEGCLGSKGGALYIYIDRLDFGNNNYTSCSASQNCGGCFVDDVSYITFSSDRFTSFPSDSHGTLYFVDCRYTVSLIDLRFIDNEDHTVYIYNSTAISINSCSFIGKGINDSTAFLHAENITSVSITNSSFTNIGSSDISSCLSVTSDHCNVKINNCSFSKFRTYRYTMCFNFESKEVISNVSVTNCKFNDFLSELYNMDFSYCNLTIANCTFENFKCNLSAGVISAFTYKEDVNDVLVINNCSFNICECTDSFGGALCISNYAFDISDCNFTSCKCKGVGGGCDISTDKEFSLNNLNFTNCSSSEEGGGLYLSNGLDTLITLTSLSFRDCSAANGSACCLRGGSYSISSLYFSSCVFTNSSTIFLENVSNINIIDCDFVNYNDVNNYQGVCCINNNSTDFSSSFSISNSTFSDYFGCYSGIFIFQSNNIKIFNSTFTDLISNTGAACFKHTLNENDNFTIDTCNFANLTSSINYGCLRLNGQSGNSKECLIVNNTVFSNFSSLVQGSVFECFDLYIYIYNSNFTFCNCSGDGTICSHSTYNFIGDNLYFEGCKAMNGSAMYLYAHGDNEFKLTNSKFYNCVSNKNGGIRFNGKKFAFDNVSFVICNTSGFGAVFCVAESYSSGEGVEYSYTFHNCSFDNNYSNSNGSSIYIESSQYSNKTYLNITSCKFYGCQGGCGVVYSRSIKLFVSDTNFSNCNSTDGGGAIYYYYYKNTNNNNNNNNNNNYYYNDDEISLSLNAVSFSSCSSGSKGGAVYVYSSSGSNAINNCSFSNCNSTLGGGLYFQEVVEEELLFNNCLFISNNSTSFGADLYFESDVELNNSNFVDCFTNCNNQSVYLNKSEGYSNPMNYSTDPQNHVVTRKPGGDDEGDGGLPGYVIAIIVVVIVIVIVVGVVLFFVISYFMKCLMFDEKKESKEKEMEQIDNNNNDNDNNTNNNTNVNEEESNSV